MSREKYKNDKYFEAYIKYERSRVAKFSTVLASLKDSDVSKAKQCERYIATFEKNILTALYSCGAGKEEFKEEFFRYLEAIEKSEISDYSEMVDILSISILLDISVNELRGVLENQLFDDALTKALKEYLQTGEGDLLTLSDNDLKFESHYNVFWEYMKSVSVASIGGLIHYVNTEWYPSCKEMSWYESHTSKENTYAGYWCWLAAAILKMKHINLEGYNMEYIPVDLI